MENALIINKEFGCVPCGKKAVEIVKIENKTKKPQVLQVQEDPKTVEVLPERLHIQPVQAVVQPRQSVCFKLTYEANVQDIKECFHYNILEADKLIARLNVHAQSVGPSLHPTTLNLKFFRFRDVNQTVKNVEITNKTNQDARFCFDLDDDYKHVEISQRLGVIPGGHKLVLKFTFNPSQPGVYYKKIFCVVQFHQPLIFNILAVYKPKAQLEPRNLTFMYPPEPDFCDNFEAYLRREDIDKSLVEPTNQPLQRCLEDLELTGVAQNVEEMDCEVCWTLFPEVPSKSEIKEQTENVFLTTNFIDVENSPEVLRATSLVNVSKFQHYYYEWDRDPKDHFQISPCKGSITPNNKVDFDIYFTPSALDCLCHTEVDVKIFLCHEKPEADSPLIIDLPLTMSLRILGHSFPAGGCNWASQCKLAPKIVCLRPCVRGECIYGNFIIEREGHLPVEVTNFSPPDPTAPISFRNFTAYPPLGHLSENFQLFVVKFDGHSKEPGIYAEDLKVKFNNSDLNVSTIKLLTIVEMPQVVIGVDNSVSFPPIFPGSKLLTTVPIKNPTLLHLCYEFKIPDDMTWVEIVNPKGSIEPKCGAELQVIFKPSFPCEYLDWIPCFVSSTTKTDNTETVRLQVTGSCQFGYLVATPSIHNLGECIYKQEKSISVHLFNFSSIILFFRLTAEGGNFPSGNEDKDVTITPKIGTVPPKGSLKINISIKPHNIGFYKCSIKCQNLGSESEEAEPCEDPREIIVLNFESVLPYIEIVDLDIYNAGPLFSPHKLWQMLRIDEINKALKSLEKSCTIKVEIPEMKVRSPPITIVFMIEARHGKVLWNVEKEIQCPCYQVSAVGFHDCTHTRSIFMRPTKYSLDDSEKLLLLINVNYDFTEECIILIKIKLSYKREVTIHMPLVNLPLEEPTCISTYVSSTFYLKPVFIGDPQPPLQLFWLYNNTDYPASYSLDMTALKSATVTGVFDCINPEGVIQPLSSQPLGIVFRPNEIKTYLVKVPLELQRRTPCVVDLVGEGVLQKVPHGQTAIPKTIPNRRTVYTEEVTCCQNFVNIPAVAMFSRISRIFFIANTSHTSQWAFRWFKFNFENIFSVRIKPEKGIIEPGEKLPMTIFIQTFCHPGYVSFSIPCEVFNFSELISFGPESRTAETAEEAEDLEFTITGKKKDTEFVKPVISSYIFITVNMNIVSKLNIEQKLTRNLQDVLKAEKEIPNNLNLTEDLNLPLKPQIIQSVRGVLEKLLWDILCSRNIAERIKTSQKLQDFTYRQIVPESKKEKKEFFRLLRTLPSKHLVQKILESTLLEIVSKNLNPVKNSSQKF